ncbi:Gfo/Idh/MocA family oxidoreductase [Maribacter antarcticus]|uniref:Gfo/Idh/MocA family oxidoreductase n=1 Tax=Maribacter antarcticus TaxID=505250 RepID=UPI00047C3B75|nr:Gfo/Idh/MocA family oxidoreductase [Maribacter antarcticus]
MKINWGVLGAATIAVEQVIPVMLQSEYSHVMAIASRNSKKANSVAEQFNIPKPCNSYEALLKDEEIQTDTFPLAILEGEEVPV